LSLTLTPSLGASTPCVTRKKRWNDSTLNTSLFDFPCVQWLQPIHRIMFDTTAIDFPTVLLGPKPGSY
jgi:hypothetical protein